MVQMKLSRMLYPQDEIEVALTSALLGGTFDEVIYWAAELHSSGWNPFPTIWRIYYNFYAAINPSLVNFLHRKEMKYIENKDGFALLSALKNIQLSKWHLDTFFLKQLAYRNVQPNHVFRGRMSSWIQSLRDNGVALPLCRIAQALLKGTWSDIIAYIQSAERQNIGWESIYDVINAAMMHKTKVNCNSQWKQLHGNVEHQLRLEIMLATLVYGSLPVEQRIGTSIFVAVNESEKQSWIDYCKNLGESQMVLARYDVLPQRVKYWIPGEIISEFNLYRTNNPNFDRKKTWKHNPEAYVTETPYWKTRIDDCKGEININGELVFDNDDNNERFYDSYWIHPDEQCDNLFDACIPPVSNNSEQYPANTLWLSFVTQSPRLKDCLIGYDEALQWLGNLIIL